MSKHHVICKSKTLDVPIIITSSIQSGSGGGGGGGVNGTTGELASPTNGNSMSPYSMLSNHHNHTVFIENNSSPNQIVAAAVKYKLDKGYSLDSKYLLNNHQGSLSSSSTNNDMTSSTNSISSSTSNKHFLSPPPSIDLIPTSIFNAAASSADYSTTDVVHK